MFMLSEDFNPDLKDFRSTDRFKQNEQNKAVVEAKLEYRIQLILVSCDVYSDCVSNSKLSEPCAFSNSSSTSASTRGSRVSSPASNAVTKHNRITSACAQANTSRISLS